MATEQQQKMTHDTMKDALVTLGTCVKFNLGLTTIIGLKVFLSFFYHSVS